MGDYQWWLLKEASFGYAVHSWTTKDPDSIRWGPISKAALWFLCNHHGAHTCPHTSYLHTLDTQKRKRIRNRRKGRVGKRKRRKRKWNRKRKMSSGEKYTHCFTMTPRSSINTLHMPAPSKDGDPWQESSQFLSELPLTKFHSFPDLCFQSLSGSSRKWRLDISNPASLCGNPRLKQIVTEMWRWQQKRQNRIRIAKWAQKSALLYPST